MCTPTNYQPNTKVLTVPFRFVDQTDTGEYIYILPKTHQRLNELYKDSTEHISQKRILPQENMHRITVMTDMTYNNIPNSLHQTRYVQHMISVPFLHFVIVNYMNNMPLK